jgi:hypothetical protein
MGHYCRICGRHRPNEKFSGHGRKIHICKKCAGMPRQKREAIMQKDDIFGILTQSHISENNIGRLEELSGSGSGEVSELAALVLEVGMETPYRRRRLKLLSQKRRDLFQKLRDTGLILAH